MGFTCLGNFVLHLVFCILRSMSKFPLPFCKTEAVLSVNFLKSVVEASLAICRI